MSVRELSYTVAGMSCGHCKTAVTEEVEQVAGVDAVEVDLDTKRVVVRGENVSEKTCGRRSSTPVTRRRD